MKNKKVNGIVTAIFFIIFGIFIILDPELTVYKFGLEYPYNIFIGTIYIIISIIYIYLLIGKSYQKQEVMKNKLLSKINGTFLTAIFAITMGIITILSPSYTKWGIDEFSNIMIWSIYVIIGSIIAIVHYHHLINLKKKIVI